MSNSRAALAQKCSLSISMLEMIHRNRDVLMLVIFVTRPNLSPWLCLILAKQQITEETVFRSINAAASLKQRYLGKDPLQ